MRWQILLRSVPGLAGILILAALTVTAVFAPWLVPYDPSALSGRPFEPPSAEHLLGTNDIGQDILSELIIGSRVSLTIGVLAAVIAVVIGTLVGVVAGYFGGVVGAVLMRVVDVALVIPFVPLMVLLAAYLGQSLWNLIVVIGLLIWARPARIIRSYVLTLARHDYILAARALGIGRPRIVLRHVLPGVFSLALAQFVLAASAAMLLESSLSFLGLGDPTQKSWGTMLFYAQTRSAFLSGAWLWWVLPPGLMITVAVLGFALVGFALEEITSPKVQRQSAPPKLERKKAGPAPQLSKTSVAPTSPEKGSS